jgi:hypothetical protein
MSRAVKGPTKPPGCAGSAQNLIDEESKERKNFFNFLALSRYALIEHIYYSFSSIILLDEAESLPGGRQG